MGRIEPLGDSSDGSGSGLLRCLGPASSGATAIGGWGGGGGSGGGGGDDAAHLGDLGRAIATLLQGQRSREGKEHAAANGQDPELNSRQGSGTHHLPGRAGSMNRGSGSGGGGGCLCV